MHDQSCAKREEHAAVLVHDRYGSRICRTGSRRVKDHQSVTSASKPIRKGPGMRKNTRAVGEFLPDALLGEHVNNNPERPAGALQTRVTSFSFKLQR